MREGVGRDTVHGEVCRLNLCVTIDETKCIAHWVGLHNHCACDLPRSMAAWLGVDHWVDRPCIGLSLERVDGPAVELRAA